MAEVAGQGTTFNLLNYTGELINVTPQDTPFLTSISGLSAENFIGTLAGAVPESAVLFNWQTTDLRNAEAGRTVVEGAAAPAGTARTRSTVHNVLEIHHEALELSYTKQAATGQFATNGSAHPGAVHVGGGSPVGSEAAFQLRLHEAQIARDIETSFLSGVFVNPATNATARETRGILAAITTNVTVTTDDALTKTMILDLLQSVWTNGGISESGTAAIIVNGFQRRALTQIFITDGNYRETSRSVGGVSVDTIVTDFGELNVMLDRHMPADTVLVASLEQCRPHVLSIPGKGTGFFVEELAKTGASDKWQLYGEIGLEYGNERSHGKITGLDTDGVVI